MFMKACQFLLVCLLACPNTSDSDARDRQTTGSFPIHSASTPAAGFPAPMASGVRSARANLANIRGGVVKEMRATSAFVHEHAPDAETSDGWLIALAALGLVVLQLRRRHMSLPQRRITPYG
jgi:hypothetical protein